MSDVNQTSAGATPEDVPVEVTNREVIELVRQFDQSSWAGLELDIHGMHLVLGRDAPPARSAPEHARPGAGHPATPGAFHPDPVPEPLLHEPPAPGARPVEPAAAAPAAAPAAPPAPTAPTSPSAGGTRTEVRAPVVGTFWVAPAPGQPPFVALGDEVVEGQQLAIVEVMKLMSDVSAPVAGRVVEIRAANAELVEFDEVLFVIENSTDQDG